MRLEPEETGIQLHPATEPTPEVMLLSRYHTVYYSHLWYSSLARVDIRTFEGNLFEGQVADHCKNFRLLSLIFDTIYIPRTHLITELFKDQWKIPARLFISTDFCFLRDSGTILVSTFPGLSSAEDNERIASRAALTTEVQYPSSTFIRKIPTTGTLEIPSRQESESNSTTFPDYGDSLGVISTKVSKQFNDIVKRATTKDLPFFHESFLTQIRRAFKQDTFERLWRDTNSIYLRHGAPTYADDMIAYFNPGIESLGFRHLPNGIDRFMFSPEVIYAFLCLFLNAKEMQRFLIGPIDTACWFLDSRGNRGLELAWFRDSYFEIAETVSIQTSMESLRHDVGLANIAHLLEGAINQSLEEKGRIVEGILDDAKGAASAAHAPTAGVIAATLRPMIRYGRGLVEDINRRRRYPDLVRFIRQLKRRLGD